jgi:ABC-2 type transport system permease protein
MISAIHTITNIIALIRKEFWEYRNTFVFVPTAMTLFLVAIMTFSAISVELHDGSDTPFLDIRYLATMTPLMREWFLYSLMSDVSILLKVILFTISIFYLCNTLFEERKNQTILLWKSFPVSDSQTVLAKWLTIAFCVPVVYWLAITLCQGTALLLTYYLASGSGLDSYELILEPAHPFTTWWLSFNFMVLDMIWLAPAYAWFLLVSAYVHRSPMVTAFAFPVVLSIAESWLLDSHDFFFTVIKRITPQELVLWVESLKNKILPSDLMNLFGGGGVGFVPDWSDVAYRYGKTELWMGLVVAVVLLAITVFVRQRRSVL